MAVHIGPREQLDVTIHTILHSNIHVNTWDPLRLKNLLKLKATNISIHWVIAMDFYAPKGFACSLLVLNLILQQFTAETFYGS